ncbi:MAG: bifunctional DNA primase/polymerase [Thaumarchaeota archaeon]|nr:bifunctional DNA primase/polymerase [Nitrososphaerota archaeon]
MDTIMSTPKSQSSLQLDIHRAARLFGLGMGLNLIPINRCTKHPASKYLSIDPVKNTPSWKIPIPYAHLFEILQNDPTLNLACVHDTRLMQIDFDDPNLIEKFFGDTKIIASHTLTCTTKRGHKVILKNDRDNDFTGIDFRPALDMELLALDHYSILPPSIHPSGIPYTVIGTWSISEMSNAKNKIISRAIQLGYIPKETQQATPTHIFRQRQPRQPLTNTEKLEIVNAIKPLWIEGYRHKLCIALLGYLVKEGVRKEDSKDIIKLIVEAAQDTEKFSRYAQVDYHYNLQEQDIAKLQGWSGIRKIAETQKHQPRQTCQGSQGFSILNTPQPMRIASYTPTHTIEKEESMLGIKREKPLTALTSLTSNGD